LTDPELQITQPLRSEIPVTQSHVQSTSGIQSIAHTTMLLSTVAILASAAVIMLAVRRLSRATKRTQYNVFVSQGLAAQDAAAQVHDQHLQNLA